ncbi:MAG: hypothetical protein A3J52_00450 [Omnitrophica bacterium RIFCSPHIGHO2_02_FULL_49_9]|nr:MAG: hypothetical protein A3J52_00450 [Omnitrophica bacterium RIFCSPHIGHO2_02_FULL_49_9]
MPLRLFRFWKKEETPQKLPESEIPLFATLSPAELKLVESKIRRVEFKKGDTVYKIGEQADAFYIILSGRFRVIGAKGDTVGILSQGDYFGESSLLLGREHSATIEAKNDGLVLRISKSDFENLLKEIPPLSIHLSRTLGHRLTVGTEVAKTDIVSIIGDESAQDRDRFVHNLAAALGTKRKKKTILVHLVPPALVEKDKAAKTALFISKYFPDRLEEVKQLIQKEHGSYSYLLVSNGVEGKRAEKQIASLLAFLIGQYDFVLLNISSTSDHLAAKVLKQSDAVYMLVGEQDVESEKTRVFQEEFQRSFGFTRDEIRLIVYEESERKRFYVHPYSLNRSRTVNVFSFLPYENRFQSRTDAPLVLQDPDCRYGRAVQFLAKELTGDLIGLALGSGAAFGFAHIGVLKVLEQEHIPIDIVSGSSIGALVGVMWANGLSSQELEHIAAGLDRKSMFFKLVGFRDLSFPHNSFFKGRQVVRYLRTFLKHVTFRELKIPVKMVATNMNTGEEVIFDDGDVVDAIRASIAIPGIFRPIRMKDQILIDGGVVDPLPVKVLNRYGVKKIIAVNVLPSSEEHLQRREFYEKQKSIEREMAKNRTLVGRFLFEWGERIRKRYQDNVFNVLVNTIQFLEHGIAEMSAEGADIVIHPVLPNSHWAEFYSVDKFVRCGEEKTREQIEEIKRLVEDSL